MNKAIIPKKLYEQIHKLMPISCVDVIIFHKDSFLLCQRKNEPAKGEYWFPGGRIHKNESLKEAAQRKVLQETGLQCNIKNLLGVDETIFDTGPFGNSTHTINIVFTAQVTDIRSFKKDGQHEYMQWFNKIPNKTHPYIRKYLKLSLAQR